MLTGTQLEDFIADNFGQPVKNVAKFAEYVKPNGKINYVKFYAERIKLRVRRDANNTPSSKVYINNLIDAIKNRQHFYYHYNDKVSSSIDKRRLWVYYKGEMFMYIDNENQIGFLRTQKSKALKERINRILMHFCGAKLYSGAGEWYISRAGCEDVVYTHENIPIII